MSLANSLEVSRPAPPVMFYKQDDGRLHAWKARRAGERLKLPGHNVKTTHRGLHVDATPSNIHRVETEVSALLR